MDSSDASFLKEANEAIAALLKGHIPDTLHTASDADELIRHHAELVNALIESVAEVQKFVVPLSQGRLHEQLPQTKNYLASPFKELHSRLMHLTWQAAQVAKGDYSQRIDVMGDFSQSFNSMVTSLRQKEDQLRTTICELEEMQEILKSREEWFRTIADFAYDWEFWIDNDGVVTYTSPSCEQISGYQPEEFLQDPTLLLRIVHPDDRQIYVEHKDVVTTVTAASSCEYRIITRSGDIRWIAHVCQAVFDSDGCYHGRRGTNRDITQQKHAEAELAKHQQHLEELVHERTARLEETLEQLEKEVLVRKRAEIAHDKARKVAEAANQAKSNFLANMSHEIRTPMTAILGYVSLISEYCSQDTELATPELDNYVNTIRRNGNHLLAVINDILDVSKIEAGKMIVERIECLPCHIVAEMVSMVGWRAEQKGLKLEVRHDGPIPKTIRTDPTRLRQILVNLVGNAIKFTQQGHVCLSVSLQKSNAKGENPRLCFEIADTGVGMSQRQLDETFKPFTQADETMTRRFGGTGLGLTIGKALVEMLGGTLSAESEPGKGSIFRFTLDTGPLDGVPMMTDCHEAVSLLPHAPVEKKEQLPNNLSARILLCEDGPDNQRLIAFLLKKAGADVTVADNGQIGLDKALAARDAGKPFDVILMDMQMPVLDGYDATRHLRAAGYRNPIIALTAHAMVHDRQKCLDAGCNDYAPKPIDRAKLLTLIASYLPHHTTAQPS